MFQILTTNRDESDDAHLMYTGMYRNPLDSSTEEFGIIDCSPVPVELGLNGKNTK